MFRSMSFATFAKLPCAGHFCSYVFVNYAFDGPVHIRVSGDYFVFSRLSIPCGYFHGRLCATSALCRNCRLKGPADCRCDFSGGMCRRCLRGKGTAASVGRALTHALRSRSVDSSLRSVLTRCSRGGIMNVVNNRNLLHASGTCLGVILVDGLLARRKCLVVDNKNPKTVRTARLNT